MLTQAQIDKLHNAAELAWAEDTRHNTYKGHPLPAVGQCYVTSRWLASKYGGHLGRKDGCYFWSDGEHALDLCGDRQILAPTAEAGWRASPVTYQRVDHPHFSGYEKVPDEAHEPRTKKFMARAERALHSGETHLSLDLGDAFPGEEPQAIENYDQRYPHDLPGSSAEPTTYNVVYGNGQLHLSADHAHDELAGHAGVPPNHEGPFAAGFVTVNMNSANWQLRSNVALHALERVLKDYGKHVGWKWGGLTDSSGQPIDDDFAPKKSAWYTYLWDQDYEHLYLGGSFLDVYQQRAADLPGEEIGEHTSGHVVVEDGIAKVSHFDADNPWMFESFTEWAKDEGLRLMAGDNVIKHHEDLQEKNIWSPTDNEPGGGQFFTQPPPDERSPGGVYKCPECQQIFPKYDLFRLHRDEEHAMGTHDTTQQPSGFPELPDMDQTFPANYSVPSEHPTNIARFQGVILRTSNVAARQVADVDQRYFRDSQPEYWTAYENGFPVGCAALEGNAMTWVSSPQGFYVTDAIISRLQASHNHLHMWLATVHSADGVKVSALDRGEFDLLTRMGFIRSANDRYRWSADQDPSKLLDAAVPFIYDVDEDKVTCGHPGERHADIAGKFTPGGIVEGTYEPGGKVIVRSLTNMPYTVRHMLELWYYAYPQFVIKSVHLRDHEGNDTKLAQTSMAVDDDYWDEETTPGHQYGYDKWTSLYHGTRADSVGSIFQNGLQPWDAPGRRHNWGMEDTPRPNHVYFTNDKDRAYDLTPSGSVLRGGGPDPDAAAIEVDPRHLDPQNINPDEDSAGKVWDTGDWDNKGAWAEGVGYGDRDEETRFALQDHDTLAHRGTVAPHAIVGAHYADGRFEPNPGYRPPRSITSNMEIGQYIANLASQDDVAWGVYKALSAAGGRVLVVGGAIRDAVMGKKPHDIDLMVTGLPHAAVLAALKRLPGKVMEHGQDFSVIRYKEHGVGEVEIALPRSDRSTGPLHTDFETTPDHTMSPEEDFHRRDFNVNAMGVDLATGKLVDPFGGAEAIRQGTFSTVSAQSFADDPLRTMRALTLVSRHGLKPDEATKEQMGLHAEKVTHLSAKRIVDELDKIFEGDDPETAMRLAHETGLMPYMIPEVARACGFHQYNPHHPEGDLGEHLFTVMGHVKELGGDPDLVLAGLLHDIGKVDARWFECKPCSKTDHKTGLRIKNPIAGATCPECGQEGEGHYYEHRQEHADGSRTVWGANHAPLGAEQAETLLRRQGYSNDRVARITHVVRHHMFPAFHTKNGARKFINQVGDAHVDDLLTLRQSDQGGNAQYPTDPTRNVDQQRELVQFVREAGEPTNTSMLAINGHDLMQAGIKPGPTMGLILKHLTELVIDNPEANNAETLLNAARMYDA